MQANMTDDPVESFYEVGIQTMLTLIFIAIMLLLNKTLYAYIQVATAVVICSNIAAISSVPALVWLTITEDTLSYYIVGLMIAWDFALMAYIIKQVLAVNFAASLVLALLYFIVTYFGAFALGQLI